MIGKESSTSEGERIAQEWNEKIFRVGRNGSREEHMFPCLFYAQNLIACLYKI